MWYWEGKEMKQLIVTEGIESWWIYHWSYEDDYTKSLCGKDTMLTNISPENWGKNGENTPDKWCSMCEIRKYSIDNPRF